MKKLQFRRRRLAVEHLENRRVLAADIRWLGTISDDWHTGGNWSGGAVPNDGDTAILEGGTIALHAHQTKNVKLRATVGGTTLSLSNFDFQYDRIDVGSDLLTSLVVLGPGSVLPHAQGSSEIDVGGLGVPSVASADDVEQKLARLSIKLGRCDRAVYRIVSSLM
jgi:hypothetical protein